MLNFPQKCWNTNSDHSTHCVKSFKLIALVAMDETRVQNSIGKCNKEARKKRRKKEIRKKERSIRSNNCVSVFTTHTIVRVRNRRNSLMRNFATTVN